MQIYKTLMLDLVNPNGYNLIYAMQADRRTRFISVGFTYDGSPYIIPKDATIIVEGKTANGKDIYHDCIVKDNMAIFELTEKILQSPGQIRCVLGIYMPETNQLLHSIDFHISITSNPLDPSSVTNSSEYSALVNTMITAKLLIDKSRENIFIFEKIKKKWAIIKLEAEETIAATNVAKDNAIQATQDLRELETSVTEAEAIRQDQEDTRQGNEDIRKANEIIRKNNEANRQGNEGVRESQETAREENEAIRRANEINRQFQENTRQSNEDTRKSNEIIRVDNEDDRQGNEVIRESQETTREENEVIRKANETNRQSQETTRQDDEGTRKTSEINRQNNEDERQENEDTRESSENTREENEAIRKANEISRTTQEATRNNSEDIRKSNETTRQQQETDRQSNTSEAIANAETATQGAIDATENADEKADKADKAAKRANLAAEGCEEIIAGVGYSGGTNLLINTDTSEPALYIPNSIDYKGDAYWRLDNELGSINRISVHDIPITYLPNPLLKYAWDFIDGNAEGKRHGIYQQNVSLDPYNEYTLSCYAIKVNTASTASLTLGYDLSPSCQKTFALASTWTKYSFTFKALHRNNIYLGVEEINSLVNRGVLIYGIKLEAGSKASDWSPSPVDTNAIDTCSFTDLADECNWHKMMEFRALPTPLKSTNFSAHVQVSGFISDKSDEVASKPFQGVLTLNSFDNNDGSGGKHSLVWESCSHNIEDIKDHFAMVYEAGNVGAYLVPSSLKYIKLFVFNDKKNSHFNFKLLNYNANELVQTDNGPSTLLSDITPVTWSYPAHTHIKGVIQKKSTAIVTYSDLSYYLNSHVGDIADLPSEIIYKCNGQDDSVKLADILNKLHHTVRTPTTKQYLKITIKVVGDIGFTETCPFELVDGLDLTLDFSNSHFPLITGKHMEQYAHNNEDDPIHWMWGEDPNYTLFKLNSHTGNTGKITIKGLNLRVDASDGINHPAFAILHATNASKVHAEAIKIKMHGFGTENELPLFYSEEQGELSLKDIEMTVTDTKVFQAVNVNTLDSFCMENVTADIETKSPHWGYTAEMFRIINIKRVVMLDCNLSSRDLNLPTTLFKFNVPQEATLVAERCMFNGKERKLDKVGAYDEYDAPFLLLNICGAAVFRDCIINAHAINAIQCNLDDKSKHCALFDNTTLNLIVTPGPRSIGKGNPEIHTSITHGIFINGVTTALTQPTNRNINNPAKDGVILRRCTINARTASVMNVIDNSGNSSVQGITTHGEVQCLIDSCSIDIEHSVQKSGNSIGLFIAGKPENLAVVKVVNSSITAQIDGVGNAMGIYTSLVRPKLTVLNSEVHSLSIDNIASITNGISCNLSDPSTQSITTGIQNDVEITVRDTGLSASQSKYDGMPHIKSAGMYVGTINSSINSSTCGRVLIDGCTFYLNRYHGIVCQSPAIHVTDRIMLPITFTGNIVCKTSNRNSSIRGEEAIMPTFKKIDANTYIPEYANKFVPLNTSIDNPALKLKPMVPIYNRT